MVAEMGFEPHDLRVMSPTSYQAALLRDILLENGAGNRGRTGTILTYHGILSPGRLPIPPFRQTVRLSLCDTPFSQVPLQYTTFYVPCQPVFKNFHAAASFFIDTARAKARRHPFFRRRRARFPVHDGYF